MAIVVKIIVRDLIVVKVCHRIDGSLSGWDQWQAVLIAEVVIPPGEPMTINDGRPMSSYSRYANIEISVFHNALAKMRSTAAQNILAFGGRGSDTQVWINERPGARSIGSIYHMTINAIDAAGLWMLYRHVRRASAGYQSKHSKPRHRVQHLLD